MSVTAIDGGAPEGNALSGLRLFDCYCMIGRQTAGPSPHATASGSELAVKLAGFGIVEALVHHVLMGEGGSPVSLNQDITKAVAGHANLHPAWGFLPPQTGELGTVADLLEAMRQADVRALWAYPKQGRFVMNGITLGELFEVMSSRRIPLFVEADWEMLHRLMPEFPGLTAVAVGHGCWGDDRYFRPLIERFPRFHVDTSRYELDGGIEDFYRRYGPERLLFGTAFPRFQAGGSILTLLHAEIPTAAKEAIAGNNLRRLLAEVDLS